MRKYAFMTNAMENLFSRNQVIQSAKNTRNQDVVCHLFTRNQGKVQMRNNKCNSEIVQYKLRSFITKCSNLWKMNYVILLKYSIMDELFLLWRTLNILEVFQLTEWRLLLRFGNQVSWKSRKISRKFVWPVRTCYICIIKDKIA